MPVFTFTADAATDQLTVVGHGLLNGDGPVAVRNLGGSLPGALAPVTDYWAILVDADHVKLATSNPNALAGTAINLTSTGTGTQLLEVGIPYRIAHSYVERAVVRSADLTAIQAALQAMHGLFTGQAQSVWSGISLAAGQSISVSGTGRVKHGDRYVSYVASAWNLRSGGALVNVNGKWTGVGRFQMPMILSTFETIEDIKFAFDRGGAGTITLRLVTLDLPSGTSTTTQLATVSSGTGWTTATVNAAALDGLGIDRTPNQDVAYILDFEADNAANVFGGATVRFTA
jgi:hypothetical protein